jgi:hypothetical protein
LYRDSASPAALDTLGEIEFNGEDSAGNKQAYALIHGSILSPTSTTEQGQLHFETATAGALTEKMIIGTTNLVINEIGAVFNVRIEGDTDANLFTTDATNSRIGVGTISPAEKVEVVGNIKLSGNVIPASGFGIDFAATSGTGTSELLADYEEGTWTMGIAFGGGTTAITYTVNTGRYIKIGKSVTVTGLLLLSNKGSSTGAAAITGLPYTIGAGNPSQSAAAARLTNITFIGQYHAVGDIGATTVSFGADTELGVGSSLTDTNFANNSLIQISYTYFVD